MNKSTPYNQERNLREYTLALTLEKHLVINTHHYIISVILNSILWPHCSETCHRAQTAFVKSDLEDFLMLALKSYWHHAKHKEREL